MEEPLWYSFIVNEEMEAYAVVSLWDENLEEFYLWTPEEHICRLIPDWKSNNKEDGIWGWFVEDTDEGNGCPFIEQEGWYYADYTYDEYSESMDPISIVGPYGNEWMFVTPEDFMYWYPEWYEEFIYILYGDDDWDDDDWEDDICYNDDGYADDYGDGCDWYEGNYDACGYYDSSDYTAWDACCACGGGYYEDDYVWVGYLVDPYGSGDYAILWFEDEMMSEVYYWNDFDQAYCVLIPDWIDYSNPEDGLYGFYVTDPEGMCPYVDEGWTYSGWWEDESSEYGYLEQPNGSWYEIIDEDEYYMYYYTEDDDDWYYEDDEESYVDE